jgi:cysteinyl-tRNA synthetase
MREVRIKDTLTGEPKTLDPGDEVGIYACGPTVYSRIHIGNARPFVVFSLLARFLKSEGYAAKLVVNVTDINDKIYVAAREAGEGSAAFAQRMTRAYFEDTDRLGLGRPDAEPLATETIDGIVALIAELVENGHAYESGGDVYFRVRSFEGYGKLSNRRAEDMDQGEEAGSESLKEDPLDFALWKAHKADEDTSWDSPWGPGRPAWHIECSVMAERELGASFAIHGGGSDLVFPHHENEIAQSEGAGRPFAKVWMHNGMIETDAAKMSKSEGNIFQLSEALDRYGREAVVDYLLSGHYRQPLAFDPGQMEQAVARIGRLRNFFRKHPVEREPGGGAAVPKRRGRVRQSNSGEALTDPPPAPASRRSGRRWRMTSTRLGPWPRCLSLSEKRTGGRCRGRLRRCLRCWSLSGSIPWLKPRRVEMPRRRRCSRSGSRPEQLRILLAQTRSGMSLRLSAGRSAMGPRVRSSCPRARWLRS